MRLNIRTRVALSLIMGVLIPSLIIGGIQLRLEYVELVKQALEDQENSIDSLRIAVEEPVWSFRTDSVEEAVNTFMHDPAVAHVQIDVGIYGGADVRTFLTITRPTGHPASSRILTRTLTANGTEYGQLRVEYDQSTPLKALTARAKQMAVLLGSILLGILALLMPAARYGLVRPLAALSEQARGMARGQKHGGHAPWTRQDEIGDLGRAFEWAEHELGALMARTEESATKFSSIFHTAPEWLTISRAHDGVFLEANRGFELASGWSAREAVGRSMLDLGIWTTPDETFLAKLKTDRGMRGYECDLIRKDGSHWRASVSAAMTTINGEMVVISAAHDVTAMRQQEQALQASIAARNAAEVANQLKSDFLAMISHEVRTPLGGVIGMLRFGLRDAALNTGTREKLAIGLTNAESLLQIINDILDYSKLEAGKLTIETLDFNLADVVRDTAVILQDRAEAKSLSLVAELDPAVPLWWQGDPNRLRQILINLAGNAVKFTQQGEVRLTVDQEAGGTIRLQVRDTGIGIAAEALPRLFNKFEQADASTSRRFGGTGLGLAISKRMVEAMGGSIEVSSELGVGTCFTVRLALSPGQPTTRIETTVEGRHSHRLRVLCAEDGATNQIILRELVTSFGHSFSLAGDGEAALDALAAGEYDLLLLDSRMPRRDGIDVLTALRAGERGVRQPDLAVIAVTANAGVEERARFMAAGAQGFLPKPIDEHALQAEIGRVIGWLIEQGHDLPVIEHDSAQPGRQLDAGSPAVASTSAMSASPAMRQAFLTEGPRLLGELRTALDAGDGTTAARSAHSLKGMAGYFAAPDLQEHARLAEQAADAGKLDEVREQLTHMQASVERVLAVMGGKAIKSDVPPVSGSTKVLGQDAINTLLATLEQQLARSSLDAETTLSTLREGLPAGEAAELAALMAKHLESFDFVAAQTSLEALQKLSPQGGPR